MADHGSGSEAVSGAAGQVVGQVSLAEEGTRAWEQELMGRVAEEANLVEALGRVCANKGSAGIDQIERRRAESVDESAHPPGRAKGEIDQRELSTGAGARGANPQAGGQGVRQLGIPTVMDRLVEQAMLQVLEPLFDPYFLGIEFRVPSRTRGARRTTAGQ